MYETLRIVGVDLGQQRDPTAIAVVERGYVNAGELYNANYWLPGSRRRDGRKVYSAREPVRLEYHVRHLERPLLGTSYVDVVERILKLLESLGDKELVLAVDTTGVGRPVKDMLNARLNEWLAKPEREDMEIYATWITITGGDSVTKAEGEGLRVPKRDLASAPLVLMQNSQLKIASEMPLAETLRNELLNFKVKINIATGHDSYEAWREGDHDDLVLAVAMACWAGERYLTKEDSLPRPGVWAQEGVPVNVIGERQA
jgi:hypothetical protein